MTEEQPDYPAVVTEYLTRHNQRRLPWGALVSGGHVTMTKSTEQRRERTELGEVAIALLSAIGVPAAALEEIAGLPWNATAAELVAKLQEIRSRDQLAG